MFFFSPLFNSFPTNRKANLKLTIERLRIQKKKRSNLADNEKRAVADLLAKDRIDDARIKCEGILKEDATCEAYEILGSLFKKTKLLKKS